MPLHEVTCLGVIAVVAATAMDIAAYDVASGAAALAVTTLSV
ncbi:hypothetical protein Lxx19470 [Leifsonia xyli subsp. xyli str. CTCB07]|uniref:Uncharacterized protein n=1 Tax=Leifsonia xyli subsp. xyli (strain CTCB07) TaxID=281090 RepID=Q6AD77_LEIXX|nr:hypothetical protein Lxx19420 [Leifsonia xyli subsp. xyli str. CTCB07]AAT89667.1 hypothetical protein Lxx19470 [Leifsonia xyli subsp. xyli str. CTCB07]